MRLPASPLAVEIVISTAGARAVVFGALLPKVVAHPACPTACVLVVAVAKDAAFLADSVLAAPSALVSPFRVVGGVTRWETPLRLFFTGRGTIVGGRRGDGCRRDVSVGFGDASIVVPGMHSGWRWVFGLNEVYGCGDSGSGGGAHAKEDQDAVSSRCLFRCAPNSRGGFSAFIHPPVLRPVLRPLFLECFLFVLSFIIFITVLLLLLLLAIHVVDFVPDFGLGIPFPPRTKMPTALTCKINGLTGADLLSAARRTYAEWFALVITAFAANKRLVPGTFGIVARVFGVRDLRVNNPATKGALEGLLRLVVIVHFLLLWCSLAISGFLKLLFLETNLARENHRGLISDLETRDIPAFAAEGRAEEAVAGEAFVWPGKGGHAIHAKILILMLRALEQPEPPAGAAYLGAGPLSSGRVTARAAFEWGTASFARGCRKGLGMFGFLLRFRAGNVRSLRVGGSSF
ncbi:hypothetical protein B0T21DRAFT_379264, partial [Apiosordaria backusii]